NNDHPGACRYLRILRGPRGLPGSRVTLRRSRCPDVDPKTGKTITRPATVLGEKSRNKASERFLRSALLYLGQRRLGLRQPERHLHGAIEVDRGRQRGTGLLLLADRGIQHAQTAVAVGLERTHAACVGEGDALPVVALCLLGLWGIATRSYLAKEPEEPCLVAPFLEVRGTLKGTPNEPEELFSLASQQIGLTQLGPPHPIDPRCEPLHHLLQQRQGQPDLSGSGISRAHTRSRHTEQVGYVPRLDECQGAFEEDERFWDLSLAEAEETDTMIRSDEGEGVIGCLSNADRFVSVGHPLGERAQLGQAPD